MDPSHHLNMLQEMRLRALEKSHVQQRPNPVSTGRGDPKPFQESQVQPKQSSVSTGRGAENSDILQLPDTIARAIHMSPFCNFTPDELSVMQKLASSNTILQPLLAMAVRSCRNNYNVVLDSPASTGSSLQQLNQQSDNCASTNNLPCIDEAAAGPSGLKARACIQEISSDSDGWGNITGTSSDKQVIPSTSKGKEGKRDPAETVARFMSDMNQSVSISKDMTDSLKHWRTSKSTHNLKRVYTFSSHSSDEEGVSQLNQRRKKTVKRSHPVYSRPLSPENLVSESSNEDDPSIVEVSNSKPSLSEAVVPASQSMEKKRVRCWNCRDRKPNALLTGCRHAFCPTCLQDLKIRHRKSCPRCSANFRTWKTINFYGFFFSKHT